MKIVRCTLMFVGWVILLVSNSAQAQWEQVGQNPQRTGLAPFVVDIGSSPTINSFSIVTGGGSIDNFMSPPITSGPFIFVGTATGQLLCWNVNLNQLEWTGTEGSQMAPAVVADVLITASGLSLYALNMHTGEQLWQQVLSGAIVHDVLVDPGTYTTYAITDAKIVYAIDVFTGQIKWMFDMQNVGADLPVGTPAITADGEFLVTASEPNPGNSIGTVYGIRTANGSFGWSKTVPDPGAASNSDILGFLTVGNYLYFTNYPQLTSSNAHGWLCRIDITNNQLIQVYSGVHRYRTKLALIPGAQWLLYGSADAFGRGIVKFDDECQNEMFITNVTDLIESADIAVDQLGDIVLGNAYGTLYRVTFGGTVKNTISVSVGTHHNTVGSPALSPQMIVVTQKDRWGYLHIVAKQQMNQIPEVLNPPSPIFLAVGNQQVIDLENPAVFFDRDGHPLSYEAVSVDPGSVGAQINGSLLTLTGYAQDTTRVIVYAEDSQGGKVAGSFEVVVSPLIGQDALDQTPYGFFLKQNYPNPFNPSTAIEFALERAGFFTLKIYNVAGENVATLVSEYLSAGSYKYNWDAGGFASGIYYYRLTAGKFAETRKMVLLR